MPVDCVQLITQKIHQIKELCPTWRVGQIIDNAVSDHLGANVFYITDEYLYLALNNYLLKCK